ncbi:MAG TPA: VOC family protein [Flavobacterium sp.]|nr:VOC family protein [Flavobacterium sp.]
MLNFPKAKLGDVNAITITSPDLEKSLKFYELLGFTELYRADFPFPWIQVSDGALLIMLRQDKDPYIALTYYVQDMDKVIADLKQSGISPKSMPTPDKLIQRFLISTEEGHNITLVTYVEGFAQPIGTTMLTMPSNYFYTPVKHTNKTCGMFGELAFPVANLDNSISFWEKLGYKTLSKKSSPYPWAILSDGLGIVGLHQTNNFSVPTITFFASDMKDKIENLKAKGLDGFDEKGNSNIVLTTPEQQKINLFKLGM